MELTKQSCSLRGHPSSASPQPAAGVLVGNLLGNSAEDTADRFVAAVASFLLSKQLLTTRVYSPSSSSDWLSGSLLSLSHRFD